MFNSSKSTNCFDKIFIVLILVTIMFPKEIFAHDAYFISSTLDTQYIRYQVSVETDAPGQFESKHMEAQLGSFMEMASKKGGDIVNSELLADAIINEYPGNDDLDLNDLSDAQKEKMEGKNDGYIYTFPSKEKSSWMGLRSKNHAQDYDYERAKYVAEKLGSSINGIMAMLNDGMAYDSVNELVLTSIYSRAAAGGTAEIDAMRGNTYKLFYGSDVSNNTPYNGSPEAIVKDPFAKGFPHADKEGNLLVYIVKDSGNGKDPTAKDYSGFIYAVPKGYIGITGVNNGAPLVQSAARNDKDVENEDTAWITIHHLTHQANFAFKYHRISAMSSVGSASVGKIEGFIIGIMRSFADGLRSFFNLYSTEELIYNQGSRGGMYEGGLMSDNWWFSTLKYHTLFQIIAWSVLSLAIVKLLIQTNFSTVNPMLKISLMESVQKFFIVGFLLIASIPIIQLMVGFNNAIVDIAATQIDSGGLRSSVVNANAFVAIAVELTFFGIELYMNFVYILRSITLAILIAMAPVFIVSMAFSVKGKGLLDNWFKELTANIFLQAFHGFAFAFIFQIQGGTSRGVEQLAVIYSLIPLTDFFRSMVFGEAGSFVGAQAKVAQEQSKGAVMTAGKMGVGAMAGGIGAAVNKRETGKVFGATGAMSSGGNGANESINNFKETSQDIATKAQQAGDSEKLGAEKTNTTTNEAGALSTLKGAGSKVGSALSKAKETAGEGGFRNKASAALGAAEGIGGAAAGIGSAVLGSKAMGTALKGAGGALALADKGMKAAESIADVAMGGATGNSQQFARGASNFADTTMDFAGEAMKQGTMAAQGGVGVGKKLIEKSNVHQFQKKDPLLTQRARANGDISQVYDNKRSAEHGVSLGDYDGRNPGSLSVNTSNMSPEQADGYHAMERMLDSDCPTAKLVANKAGFEGVSRDASGELTFALNDKYYQAQGIKRVQNQGNVTQVTKKPGFQDPISFNTGVEPQDLAMTTIKNFEGVDANTIKANLDTYTKDKIEKINSSVGGDSNNQYINDSPEIRATKNFEEAKAARVQAGKDKAREEADKAWAQKEEQDKAQDNKRDLLDRYNNSKN